MVVEIENERLNINVPLKAGAHYTNISLVSAVDLRCRIASAILHAEASLLTHLWEEGASVSEVEDQMEYYSMEAVYYHVAIVPSSLQYGRQDLGSIRCE